MQTLDGNIVFGQSSNNLHTRCEERKNKLFIHKFIKGMYCRLTLPIVKEIFTKTVFYRAPS